MLKQHPLVLQTETLDRCPICGSSAFQRILTAPDHESHTGNYGVDECTDCSAAFTNPRPLEEELPKLYERRTTADFAKMGGFAQRLRGYAIDRYLAHQLGELELPANGDQPFAVLDYGCGDGALVLAMLRFGHKYDRPLHVTAVDFHDTPPPALANVGPVVTYQVNAAWHLDRGHCYDVIFLRHVLEHHPQPLRLLSELGATLRPGGRLFIEVPNRQSVWARMFGCYYFGYYVPRHLFHFDRASLAGALRRAGFRDVTVRRAHHPLIGGSLGYLTGFRIRNTSMVGLASFPFQIGLDAICKRSTTLLAVGYSNG
jgi:SAM-dependent methyltransferase